MADTATPDKKKIVLPTSMMIIIGAVTAVVIILIATIFTVLILTHKPVPKIPKYIDVHEHTMMVPMREFIVNLLDYGGRRYLKVTMDLEYEPEDGKIPKSEGEGKGPPMPDEIKKKETMLRNYIINILSSSSFNDIKSIEGKNVLRKTIILKCNMVLKSGKVLNVYFNDFILQ